MVISPSLTYHMLGPFSLVPGIHRHLGSPHRPQHSSSSGPFPVPSSSSSPGPSFPAFICQLGPYCPQHSCRSWAIILPSIHHLGPHCPQCSSSFGPYCPQLFVWALLSPNGLHHHPIHLGLTVPSYLSGPYCPQMIIIIIIDWAFSVPSYSSTVASASPSPVPKSDLMLVSARAWQLHWCQRGLLQVRPLFIYIMASILVPEGADRLLHLSLHHHGGHILCMQPFLLCMFHSSLLTQLSLLRFELAHSFTVERGCRDMKVHP
jgi:hypothetical protein